MFPGFDPSKLDPKMIQELSDLMRTLPPEKLMQMQSLMHNSMAGFDISKEMQAFESSLPGEFRLRLANIMVSAGPLPADVFTPPAGTPAKPIESVDDARLTLLNAVRDGALSPEEALKALFS
jgi:hypothetical protein